MAKLGLMRDQLEVIERYAATRPTPSGDPPVTPTVFDLDDDYLIESCLVNFKLFRQSFADWCDRIRKRHARFDGDDLLRWLDLLRRYAAVAQQILRSAERAESMGVRVNGIADLRAARRDMITQLSTPMDTLLRSLALQLKQDDLDRLSRFETPLDQWPEQPDDLIAD